MDPVNRASHGAEATTLEQVLLDIARTLGGDPGRHAPTEVLACRTNMDVVDLPLTADGRGGRIERLLCWTGVVRLSAGTYSGSSEADYALDQPTLALLRYDARPMDATYPNCDEVGPEVLRLYPVGDEAHAIADLIERT